MIRFILNPTRSGYIFAAAILLGYGLVPLWFYLSANIGEDYLQLAMIAILAAAAVALGFYGHRDPINEAGKLPITVDAFTALVWIPFVLIALLILVTAPAIPLVTALQGGSPDLIALQREEFLKSREGIAAVFVYLNAFFTGALIPYSIALMFIHKYRWRWVLTGIALLYTISFVEKAFFLKVALPLIYLFGTGAVRSRFGPKTTVAIAAVILLFVTTVSGTGSEPGIGTSADFFSSDYAPTGPIDHIIWRSLAVPVFTAADALRVFANYFNGEWLWGATSSFVTGLFGMERIPFERLVFEAEWGQNETGTGSSNSVYLTEAFVNFGWVGVILFSLFIGRSFTLFARSRNEAFRAIWPLFAMGLYSAGLIGTLLSNGFLAMLLIGLFVHIKPREAKAEDNQGELTWGT